MDRLITQYRTGVVIWSAALCALIVLPASAIAQTTVVDTKVSPIALPPRGAESVTAPALILMPESEAIGPSVARLAKTALQRRLVLELDVGVHLCAGDYLCKHSVAGLAVRSSALYAVRRYMAVGLHVDFFPERKTDLPDGEPETNKSVLVAAEYRVRVPVKRALLWAGIIWGYWHRWKEYGSDRGMVVGLGLGTDLFVSPGVAFGTSTWLYLTSQMDIHWILGAGIRFDWVPLPR